MSFSIKTSVHETRILELLLAQKGQWVSGLTLFSQSETTTLGSRISTLRDAGWIIESRKGASASSSSLDGEGFSDYRLTGKTAPRGRQQLQVKVPAPAQGSAHPWTPAEVQSLQEACNDAIAFRAALLRPAVSAPQRDWFDDLLSLSDPTEDN